MQFDRHPDAVRTASAPALRIQKYRRAISRHSSSRYSPGTSSSGTSRVRTSFPSRSPESSTPATIPASNEFPSSNNSSTLSESTLSTLDKPCRSPDCNPEGSGRRLDEPAWRRSLRLFLLIPILVFSPGVFANAFFFAVAFFGTASLFDNCFEVFRFCTGRRAGAFLVSLFFALVDFFLLFFLVAIRAV